MDEKKSFDDERYWIPGTDAFYLSKWSRENDPKPPAQYKAGDKVVVVIEAEVVRVFEDCDGTPLYELSPGGGGWSEHNLLPGADDDWKHAAPELARAALERIKLESR